MIHCAVMGDGVTSPASDVFNEMAAGCWENPNSKTIPDLDQIEIVDELFVICEEFADYGEPACLSDINQLEYGVWEFKSSWARATFYDTDGVGGYVPKTTRYSLRNPSWEEIPEFDPHIRIATCLSKNSQTTPENDKKYARRVRQEDLAHDKAASRTNANPGT